MKQITVTKSNGATINLANKNLPCTIVSATQEWTLNGDDLVKVTVKSAVALNLGIGDTISVFGRTYKMNRVPKVTKNKTHLLQYECEYEGIQYDLMRVTYDLTIDTTSCQLQDIQADSLTGDLARFASVLVSNANRVFPGEWAVGICPDTDADRCLTFGEDTNCLSVLQQLCQEFEMEFEIATSAGVNFINFKSTIGTTFPYTFKFGHSGGLYNLQRLNVDSSNIVTRLKVFGSTQNITTKYRANRLCLPGKSKGQSYIEDATAMATYGIYEATKYFDDIKPTFSGTVTSIVAGNVLQFVDKGMFDLCAKDGSGGTLYLLSGVSAKVHFNSGNLAGYEFDIQSFNYETHTFTLCKQTDERGDQFPSASSAAFQIKAGDTYKLIDVALPDTYVDAAETTLAEQGAEYLETNSQPLVKYALSISKAYLEALMGVPEEAVANVFQPGDYIPIQDTDIGVKKSVRVQQISRNILDAYDYELSISDTASTNITTRVISDIQDIQDIIVNNNLQDSTRARANWRTSRELHNMVFDPEGDYYTEKIKPNSIDTLLLSVGAKSMQFGLVGTVFEPNYSGDKNAMKVTGGTLVHYTIDDAKAVSWTLADNTYTFKNDSDAFYIYAKCSRSTNAGTILFSTKQIACEADANYYHFWIGVLHAVDADSDIRDISLSYGFTLLNGRYITTGRIQSADGKNYIDLDENKIRFGNDSCYIDWNVTKNGQFSMRNVKVVSGSGDAFDIPVYREDWSATTIYYSGDTVTYNDGTTSATYMYINSTPSAGHAVSETAYWKVYASGGAKGDNGKSPYVGTNGNWFEYNAETGAYEDTGIAAQGEKGEKGDNGKSPSSPYRGTYSASATYYGCNYRCDIVLYQGAYYRARVDAPASPFSAILPTNTNYWEQFGASYENIATGFLFASEAVIENAVVRILRTAESGKRIVIQNNEMAMYDANNGQKLLVSGDDIDIGTPSASYPLAQTKMGGTYSVVGASGQDQGEMTICSFTVSADGSQVRIPEIEITEDEQQGYYGGLIEMGSMSICVVNRTTGASTVLTQAQGEKGTIYIGGTLDFDAGTYDIKVAASWEWTVDAEAGYGNWISVAFENASTGNVVVTSSTLQTIQIGANGIAIHLGNSFSAVFALDNSAPTMLLQGLSAAGKTIGLRITQTNGVQINRGSGWVSL